MTDRATTTALPTEPEGLERIGECRVLRNVAEQPGVETLEGRLVPLMGGIEPEVSWRCLRLFEAKVLPALR